MSRQARSTPSKPGREDTVAVIAFDGISPFHLSVPCLVFGEERDEAGASRYRLLVCGVEGGPLRTNAGFHIEAAHGLRALAQAGLVIVPSWRDDLGRPPEALLNALRNAHQRGARIVGWPRPACSTAGPPPPIGIWCRPLPNATRRCSSTRRCSTWTMATSSRPPAPQRPSTAACT
jgi:hypothetical protein